jgi:hypothetical protein
VQLRAIAASDPKESDEKCRNSKNPIWIRRPAREIRIRSPAQGIHDEPNLSQIRGTPEARARRRISSVRRCVADTRAAQSQIFTGQPRDFPRRPTRTLNRDSLCTGPQDVRRAQHLRINGFSDNREALEVKPEFKHKLHLYCAKGGKTARKRSVDRIERFIDWCKCEPGQIGRKHVHLFFASREFSPTTARDYYYSICTLWELLERKGKPPIPPQWQGVEK